MKVYTRTGDDGTTALFHGKRVLKSDPQVEAYGTIDELSSFIGLVISKTPDKNTQKNLTNIQQELHDIMAYLAGAKSDLAGAEINRKILAEKVKMFEREIDNIQAHLSEINRFILPQGMELSCWFHILRTVCRRAERNIIRYNSKLTVKQLNNETIIKYLNRLSDLFFVLGRFYNKNKEILV